MPKQLPCPKCGKTPEETGAFFEGFCPICYFQQHPLISLKHAAKVKVCPRCEAYWSGGQWVARGDSTIGEHLHNMACDLIDPLLIPAQPATFEVRILDDVEQSIAKSKKMRIEITAKAENSTYTETKNIIIPISAALCETCKRTAGGYFEAVLQVRSSTGKLAQEQEATIVDFLDNHLTNLEAQPGTIKLSHPRGGIDIKCISSRLGQSLAKLLASRFGLLLGVSGKIVGRARDGRTQTRLSFILRFPPFKVGDVLAHENHVYLIEGIHNGNYILIDLESGNKRTYNPKELSVFEGKSLNDEVQEYQVISKSSEFFQLMSLPNYTIYYIPIPSFPLEVGTTIRAILWKNRLHLIPHLEQ